ncbi:MAG: hypothetical protein RLY93_03205 [Sumerlaeia bacterium]
MSQQRQFPCPSCGAKFEFDPGAATLRCPYCEHVEEIPQSAEQVREMDFHRYFAAAEVTQEVIAGSACEVDCVACGASVDLPANVSADECPFCGTHLSNPAHQPKSVMKPQAILPFAIEKRQALESLRNWIKGRWFAPNDFKKLAREGKMEGMYVPYWTYDSYTISYYSGERGDAYWVTVKDSQGNNRRERRVRWSHKRGRVDHFFDDVLVCASQGLPPKYIDKLEPWDLPNLVDAREDYLAGFRAERYQVDAKEGFAHARVKMDSSIRGLVRRDIGGDEQRIHSIRTQHEAVTFKHVLLPIWLTAYRYRNEPYRVLINARTGEVQGERPWSWIKITLAVLAALAVAGIVAAVSQMK